MTDVALSQLRINQLRKQHFFGDRPKNFFEIAESQLGLHSTDYWTPYISVWARIGDYNAQNVFQSLNCGNDLVRINAFRRTIFVIHKNNLSMILAATGPMLYQYIRKGPNFKDLSDQEIKSIIESLVKVLEEKPLKARELKRIIPKYAPTLRSILFLAMATGKVIRASATHAKSKQITYAVTSEWISDLELNRYTEHEALIQLIRKYVKIFGPVSEEDISWWLGLPKTPIRSILKGLDQELITYEINENPYYLEKQDFELAKSLDPIVEPNFQTFRNLDIHLECLFALTVSGSPIRGVAATAYSNRGGRN